MSSVNIEHLLSHHLYEDPEYKFYELRELLLGDVSDFCANNELTSRNKSHLFKRMSEISNDPDIAQKFVNAGITIDVMNQSDNYKVFESMCKTKYHENNEEDVVNKQYIDKHIQQLTKQLWINVLFHQSFKQSLSCGIYRVDEKVSIKELEFFQDLEAAQSADLQNKSILQDAFAGSIAYDEVYYVAYDKAENKIAGVLGVRIDLTNGYVGIQRISSRKFSMKDSRYFGMVPSMINALIRDVNNKTNTRLIGYDAAEIFGIVARSSGMAWMYGKNRHNSSRDTRA
jgi:hypothetical protein